MFEFGKRSRRPLRYQAFARRVDIVSGVLLLFPILAPERALGRAGLWPMAILHLAVGYLLTLFLVVHIYLATTGETFFSLIREMIFGKRPSDQNRA